MRSASVAKQRGTRGRTAWLCLLLAAACAFLSAFAQGRPSAAVVIEQVLAGGGALDLGTGHDRFLAPAPAPGRGQDRGKDAAAPDVEIEPLSWQRGWFQAALALLAVLLVFAIIRWRSRHQRQRAAQLEAIIEQRTRDLRDQTERLMRADQEKTVLLARLQEQAEAFERQALEDALTGLANRRGINEELARAFDRATASDTPLSLVLLDLDHFKRINDTYTHLTGDHALVAVARVLAKQAGTLGIVARWGGEEFAVLFEGIDLDEARRLGERMREAVERLDCADFAPGLRMTISGGVSERSGLAYYEKLISRADDLLYEAKRSGRNRICG